MHYWVCCLYPGPAIRPQRQNALIVVAIQAAEREQTKRSILQSAKYEHESGRDPTESYTISEAWYVSEYRGGGSHGAICSTATVHNHQRNELKTPQIFQFCSFNGFTEAG